MTDGLRRGDFERAVLASNLTTVSRCLLLALAVRADWPGGVIPERFSPSLSLLAQDIGASRRAVMDHLNITEDLGWLKRTRPDPHRARVDKERTQYALLCPVMISDLGEDPSSEARAPDALAQEGARAPDALGLGQEMPGARAGDAPNQTSSHTDNQTTTEPPTASPNAGSILADWIDYCAGKNVTLTKQAIGRYGKKIKELLDQGFSVKLIKNALATMLERGQESRPGLLDNLIIEVQRRPPASQYRTSVEKNDDRQRRELAIARIADRLIETGTCSAAADALAQARVIFERESTERSVSGYSGGVEQPGGGTHREVTA